MTSQGIRDGLQAAMLYDGRRHLLDIQAPTLIIVGERNKATHAGAKLLHDGIPHSQLMKMPGGHIIHIENSDRFYATVTDFLGDKI